MNIFKKTIVNDQVASLQTELTDTKLEFESVKEELKTAQEEAAHYQLEYTALNEMFETLKLEVDTLKTENALLASNTASVEIVAVEMAAEIVAEQLGDTPAAVTDDGSYDMSIKESFVKLQGSERTEFYNQNKEEIFKALKTK